MYQACTKPWEYQVNKTQFTPSRIVHPGWVTGMFTITIMQHSESCVHGMKNCHGIPEKETVFPCSLCIPLHHYLTTTAK